MVRDTRDRRICCESDLQQMRKENHNGASHKTCARWNSTPQTYRQHRKELLGMAEQGSTREEISYLTPEELRDMAGVLPDLNGETLWHKKVMCDYCYQDLGTDVLVLQKIGRNGITFMCLGCVSRLFKALVG